jgi:hypothetical protein
MKNEMPEHMIESINALLVITNPEVSETVRALSLLEVHKKLAPSLATLLTLADDIRENPDNYSDIFTDIFSEIAEKVQVASTKLTIEPIPPAFNNLEL